MAYHPTLNTCRTSLVVIFYELECVGFSAIQFYCHYHPIFSL